MEKKHEMEKNMKIELMRRAPLEDIDTPNRPCLLCKIFETNEMRDKQANHGANTKALKNLFCPAGCDQLVVRGSSLINHR
ncbi:hypothetical protein HAX54_029979, partial [Datura stramonium]|nr:hypothetical protein [Datura stramonium]